MLTAGHPLRDGRYRITRVLGEGSQATTFEAVDAKLAMLGLAPPGAAPLR